MNELRYKFFICWVLFLKIDVFCLIEKSTTKGNEKLKNTNDSLKIFEKNPHHQTDVTNISQAGTKNNPVCAGNLCIPTGYDRLSLPKSESPNHGALIKLGFTIMSILEVNDKDFSFTLSMYLALSWKDSQLTKDQSCEMEPCYVPLDTEIISSIWHPDLYIYNLKSIQVLQVFNKFEGEFIGFEELFFIR